MNNDNKKQLAKQQAAQAIKKEQGAMPLWNVSLLLSLPFGYVVNQLLNNVVTHDLNIAITLVFIFITAFFIRKPIRKWLNTKPSNSSWHLWLG
jgi:hypothetical protein